MKNDQGMAFVDTSFFKAIIDPKDKFHQQAKKIEQKVNQQQISLITSNYVLDESFTLIRIKCGLEIVNELRKYLTTISAILKIVRVSVADEAGAWDWFLKDWSKLSFTDCVSFALMKRLGLKKAAAFDAHFTKAGFELA
ncbi:PIN domain-containing protein [Candidatus Daviesbacteria bacterium]|nr:PIN domain-containing protein [Candidatus Daviesbacteria bacterium]